MSGFLAFLGLPNPFLPKTTSGIYAPTLRFHEGTFYQTSTLVNQALLRVNDSRWDNSVLTTSDPLHSYAWSDPVHLSFSGFDLSAFRDGSTYISGAHMATYYREACTPAPHGSGNCSYFQAVGMLTSAKMPTGTGGLPHSRFAPVEATATPRTSPTSTWGTRGAHARDVGEGQLTPPSPSYPGACRADRCLPKRPRKGVRRALNGVGDLVLSSPGSKLPIHIVHHRLPKPRNYVVPPPDHPNTLALGSSGLNLTGFNGDFARDRGKTFIGRWTAHSLFRFRGEVNWTDSLEKGEMEVGVSAFQDQSQHFDLGVVMHRPPQQQDDGACPEENDSLPCPHLRFRRISQTPYRALTGMPSDVFPMPEEWTGRKLTQQIETVNSTHYAFSAGPAEHLGESQLRAFGYSREDGMVLTIRVSFLVSM
ncbi:hypothetical protein DL769_007379 [Monosporascus sp. CRB-8-3]|nr:hypothetical protein DL769_007379 [Monosporascus sp. CRB-8-3]